MTQELDEFLDEFDDLEDNKYSLKLYKELPDSDKYGWCANLESFSEAQIFNSYGSGKYQLRIKEKGEKTVTKTFNIYPLEEDLGDQPNALDGGESSFVHSLEKITTAFTAALEGLSQKVNQLEQNINRPKDDSFLKELTLKLIEKNNSNGKNNFDMMEMQKNMMDIFQQGVDIGNVIANPESGEESETEKIMDFVSQIVGSQQNPDTKKKIKGDNDMIHLNGLTYEDMLKIFIKDLQENNESRISVYQKILKETPAILPIIISELEKNNLRDHAFVKRILGEDQ